MGSSIFLQTTVNGLMIGGVYALVAVGLTLIFGVMKIVNFAQGEFVMLGMYTSWIISRLVGLGPYESLPIAAVILFAIAYIVFKSMISRVIGKNDEACILLTLGLSIFLQNIVLLIFSADYFTVVSSLKDSVVSAGDLTLTMPRLVAFSVALLMVAVLTFVLQKTDTGRAMRACAESREIATLLGIDPMKSFTLAFCIGIVLAGIAGVLLTPMFYVFPGVGTLFNTTAFVVVVLGGMGSVPGALLGGLLIGIVESLTGSYVSLDLSQLSTFVIFLIVLFFRPSGLFGRPV